jgi:hypothetical protein
MAMLQSPSYKEFVIPSKTHHLGDSLHEISANSQLASTPQEPRERARRRS